MLKAQETSRKRSREDEEKEDVDGKNEGSAAANSTITTTQKSTTTTTSTTSKTNSKVEGEAMRFVCMVNEPSAKIRPSFGDVYGVYGEVNEEGSTGVAGLWPTSLKNLSELASSEGFNDYFRDLFNGNEASWRRWKEVFDVLGIPKGGSGSIETQVLRITNSEDLVKLRALAKLCSQEFFDDKSLLVIVWRRIMEMLETAKKVGGEKGEKEERDPRKLEMLNACYALGLACNFSDFEDARNQWGRLMRVP
ncbi:hypothetical protein TrLO_g2129 [Triparma laevis f. longispina]|uniref:Uncharacterized protein n=1 Tax=Triparma laevis f. longispina TaxID=1714387 RepID=A0A9W7FL85_9STRA|nr:hypothetical protein TrLO_g2129 [Triparma laevis f. longispina]